MKVVRNVLVVVVLGAILIFGVGIVALLVLAFTPSDSSLLPQSTQEEVAGWIGAVLIILVVVGVTGAILVITPWLIAKEARNEVRGWQARKRREARNQEKLKRQDEALEATPTAAAKALLGRDLDDQARLQVLAKLEGRQNQKQIVDVLVKLARRPRSPKEHVEVLTLLGSSDDPRAFPPIFESFVKSKRRGAGYSSEASEAWRSAHAALLEHGNEAMAIFALEESGRMAEAELRINAISLACEIGGRTLFEKVLQALRSRALSDYLPSEPMKLLVEGLKHRSDPCRALAWRSCEILPPYRR